MFVGNRGGYRNFQIKRDKVDSYGKGGLTVEVRNNDVNKALRKLKKKVKNAILKAVEQGTTFGTPTERENILAKLVIDAVIVYIVKPSEKKRLAKKAGRNRWLKKQREMEANWGRPESRKH